MPAWPRNVTTPFQHPHVYMNPITAFSIGTMNYHLEHQISDGPYNRLKDLHEEIKGDLPATTLSNLGRLSELSRDARQRRDPYFPGPSPLGPAAPVTMGNDRVSNWVRPVTR